MSPIDKIREGIQRSSWKLVVDGFRLLTGEALDVPAAATPNQDRHLLLRLRDAIADHLGEPAATPVEPEAEGDDDDDDEQEEEEEDEVPDLPLVAVEPEAEPEEEPEQPQPETEDTRARQVRDANVAGAFAIEHTGDGAADVDEKKGKKAKSLPMDTKPSKNRWRDDGKLAAKELDESKKLSQEFTGKEHREEYKAVRVVCSRCDKKYTVHPDNMPRRCDPADEVSKYICDRCIGRVAPK